MSVLYTRPGSRMKWYDGYDAAGRRRKFSLRTADTRLAKLRKAQWDQKFLRAASSSANGMTIGALWIAYLKKTANRRTAASQAVDERRSGHVLTRIGHRPLTDFSHALIDDTLAELQKDFPRMGLPTRDKYLKLFKAVSRWAMFRGDLEVDSTKGLTPLAPKGQRVHVPAHLWVALLARAAHSKYLPGLYTMLHTGVRPSEAHHLDVRDFWFDRHILHIRAEVSKTKEERWLPLTDADCAFLRPRMPASGLAFPYYWPRFGRTITKWLKELGITGRQVGAYALRHGFGTEAGKLFNPKEVQAMMGHKSYQTTMGYLHVEKIAVSPERMEKLGTSHRNSRDVS